MFRGNHHPHPEPAEAITAELLRAAGVALTGVDIGELDAAPYHRGSIDATAPASRPD